VAHVLPQLLIVLAGACVLLVIYYLWQSLSWLGADADSTAGAGRGIAERTRLLERKQELLTVIRDIRFEHDLGKISDADFKRMDADYRARARAVLRELDEQLGPYREQARALIEEAAGGAPKAATAQALEEPVVDEPAAEAELGDEEAAASAADQAAGEATETESGRCPGCGTDNDQDAIFCKRCATRLREEQSA